MWFEVTLKCIQFPVRNLWNFGTEAQDSDLSTFSVLFPQRKRGSVSVFHWEEVEQLWHMISKAKGLNIALVYRKWSHHIGNQQWLFGAQNCLHSCHLLLSRSALSCWHCYLLPETWAWLLGARASAKHLSQASSRKYQLEPSMWDSRSQEKGPTLSPWQVTAFSVWNPQWE